MNINLLFFYVFLFLFKKALLEEYTYHFHKKEKYSPTSNYAIFDPSGFSIDQEMYFELNAKSFKSKKLGYKFLDDLDDNFLVNLKNDLMFVEPVHESEETSIISNIKTNEKKNYTIKRKDGKYLILYFEYTGSISIENTINDEGKKNNIIQIVIPVAIIVIGFGFLFYYFSCKRKKSQNENGAEGNGENGVEQNNENPQYINNNQQDETYFQYNNMNNPEMKGNKLTINNKKKSNKSKKNKNNMINNNMNNNMNYNMMNNMNMNNNMSNNMNESNSSNRNNLISDKGYTYMAGNIQINNNNPQINYTNQPYNGTTQSPNQPYNGTPQSPNDNNIGYSSAQVH